MSLEGYLSIIPALPLLGVAAYYREEANHCQSIATKHPEGNQRLLGGRYYKYHQRQFQLTLFLSGLVMLAAILFLVGVEYRSYARYASTSLQMLQAAKYLGIAAAGGTGIFLLHIAYWRATKPAQPSEIPRLPLLNPSPPLAA